MLSKPAVLVGAALAIEGATFGLLAATGLVAGAWAGAAMGTSGLAGGLVAAATQRRSMLT